MTEANYLTVDELTDIASMLEALRRIGQTRISFGDIPLADSNGEHVGIFTFREPGLVFVAAVEVEN